MQHRFGFAGLVALASIACGGGKTTPTTPTTPTPSPACAYEISPAAAAFPPTGGSATIRVQTSAGCEWTASVPASWLSIAPAAGSGSADVVVTAIANDAANERSGQATIAGRVLSVRQEGRTVAPCTYALSPGSNTASADGGRVSFQVEAPAHCSWTATTIVDWVTIGKGSGTGSGVVEYEVAAYTGTVQRETTIAVADRTFIVRQDPPVRDCVYSVDPTTARVHWHGPGLNVQLSTNAGCTWTASAGASWMQLTTPAAGAGSAQVSVAIDNYTVQNTRSAALMLRWPTETAGQNVWITQEGCSYALGPRDLTIAAAGGRQWVTIIASPMSVDCMVGCPWDIRTNVAWIHFAGLTSGAGDHGINIDIDANTTGLERTGIVTLVSATLTVRQGR